MKRYEYKVIDTGKHIDKQLNELGAQGWQVVGVTTKKQLLKLRKEKNNDMDTNTKIKKLELERELAKAERERDRSLK